MATPTFESSGDDGPTSTPDWTVPFGVTTPRIDTRVPQQASGYPASWDSSSPKVEVEDRGKRSEMNDDAIWVAYREGY